MRDDQSQEPMHPGKRIKLYRMRRGLTQEVAAQLKGCSVGAWRKWESGERSVNSLADWIEIARILGVRDLYRLTGLPIGGMPDDPTEHESTTPLRAALYAYTPASTEVPPVADLRAAVNLAWDTWTRSGQRYTYTAPVLPGLIHSVRAATTTLQGDERREAYRIAADLYQLVRAYSKRIGARDLAVISADRALAAAYDADDPAYRASAAWNVGQVLSNGGHAEESVDVGRAAISELERVDSDDPVLLATLGGLYLLLSIQYARLRDERRTYDVLDRADEIARRTGDTVHHHIYFGPTNCGIHRTAAMLELSRFGETLRMGSKVDAFRSPSIERRHSHMLCMARAYTTRRDDLAAVTVLSRADRESPEDSRLNLNMRSMIRELLARETPMVQPDLRVLAERVGVI